MNSKKYLTSDIYYIDNFLPNDFINDLRKKLINAPWVVHYTDPSVNINNFFWATFLEESYYESEIKFFREQFRDKRILRIYANGQTLTQHGDFHSDDGDRTYLIGMSENWNMNSGGATEFIINEDDFTTMSIYPKYNRMISFPANVRHRALANLNMKDFRITLAIKTENLEERKENNQYKINFL